jgi:hypothetical protein
MAGPLAAFVLNLPSRFLGTTVSLTLRGVAVLVLALFCYLLWILGRVAYRSLVSAAPEKNEICHPKP